MDEVRKNKRKNLKGRRGITLVALIITIILLLILAGISIATLTNSELFEKARLAELRSKNAQELEDATLKDYENKIGEYIDSSRDTISISKEEYEKLQKKGTWELLASSTSTTETEHTVKNLSQFSSIVLVCYDYEYYVDASTIVSYDIFKQRTSGKPVVASYYTGGKPYISIAKYVNDTTVKLICHTENTVLTELYGIY